jgi:hypothetical protein
MNFLRIPLCAAALLVAACGSDPDDTTGASDTDASTTATTGGGSTSTGTTGEDPATGAEPTTNEDPSTGDEPSTGDATASSTGSTDGTTGGGAKDCELDPNLEFTRDGTIYQLQSEDGATCVWLKRRDDSEPDVIYKEIPYTLLEFKFGRDGAVVHITDLAKLTWDGSHHNWTDAALAEGDGVRYRLDDLWASDEGGEAFVVNKFALSGRDPATDAVLWGPILLYPFPK